MPKKLAVIILAALLCFAVLPLAYASGTSLTSVYSGGEVTVTGSGFGSNAQYMLRIVNGTDSSITAVDQVTSDGSGNISASVTTGLLGTLSGYIVYANKQDGKLAAQGTISAKATGTESSGSGSATNVQQTTGENGTTYSAVVSGTKNASGTANASISSDTLNSLAALAAFAEESGKKTQVHLNVDTPSGCTSAAVELPRGAFNKVASGTDADLTVSTGLASLTFDPAAVESISGSASSGNISINITAVDPEALSESIQMAIGDRPVYNFNVTAGATLISSFGGGSVNVGIPYTLKAGEDAGAVVVYYIDGAGTLRIVRGAYNASTGMVEFTAEHFSTYAVGCNAIAFKDVLDGAWYREAVTFVAARGIAEGTGDSRFAPDAELTRGQFLVMILRAYGISPDGTASDNFSDAGDTYYTNYLSAAKRLGITDGVGGNRFAPDESITREDMFTLLYRMLDALGELPESAGQKTISDFGDSASVSGYALEAVETLVESGIISGNGGNLSPRETTSRAQMAQLLYNLLSK